MKKQLRNGGDYVAVDLVDEKGNIVSTPIYLPNDKAVMLQWFDREEGKYVDTLVAFDGSILFCSDRSSLKWESKVEELLTEVKI